MFPEGRNIATNVTNGEYSLRYNAEICSAFGHANFAVRAVNCAGMGPSAVHISNSPPNTIGTLLEPPLAWVGEEGEVGRSAGIIWLGVGETPQYILPIDVLQHSDPMQTNGVLVWIERGEPPYPLGMVGACPARSPTPPLPHVHLTANIILPHTCTMSLTHHQLIVFWYAYR